MAYKYSDARPYTEEPPRVVSSGDVPVEVKPPKEPKDRSKRDRSKKRKKERRPDRETDRPPRGERNSTSRASSTDSPPPGGHIDVDKTMTTGTVLQQYQGRESELERDKDVIIAGIDVIEREAKVDAQLDLGDLAKQLQALVPDIPEDESDPDPERNSRNRDYSYTSLQSKLEALQDRRAEVDAQYHPIFDILVEKTRQALQVFAGTANLRGEDRFCQELDIITAELNRFIEKDVPQAEKCHHDSQEIDQECAAFEGTRNSVDWTPAMITAEAELYKKVDGVLGEALRVTEASNECLAHLQQLKSTLGSPGGTQLEREEAQAESDRYGRRKRSVERWLATDIDAHGQLTKKLEVEIKDVQLTQEITRNTVKDIAAKMKILARQLALEQLKLWQQDKHEVVLQETLNLLNARHTASNAEAKAIVDEYESKLKDVEAHIQATSITDAMTKEVNKKVDKHIRAQENIITKNIFTVLEDRLHLMARKYHKTALAVFAANSRVDMKNQEKEGVLVRKQRCNAAQDTEGVAECNRMVELIENRIKQEMENKASLEGELASLASQWGELYKALGSLNLPLLLRDAIPKLKLEWQNVISNLQRIEQEQHKKMYHDVLDAGYMASMR